MTHIILSPLPPFITRYQSQESLHMHDLTSSTFSRRKYMKQLKLPQNLIFFFQKSEKAQCGLQLRYPFPLRGHSPGKEDSVRAGTTVFARRLWKLHDNFSVFPDVGGPSSQKVAREDCDRE